MRCSGHEFNWNFGPLCRLFHLLEAKQGPGERFYFIWLFYKGCLGYSGCGIRQSMTLTYRCNSLHPLVVVVANTKKTIKKSCSRWSESCSLVCDAGLFPPGEAYILTCRRLLLPLWQINKSGLKLEGIFFFPARWVQSCSKCNLFFFLFPYTVWSRALVLTQLMKWRERNPKPADTVSLRFHFKTLNVILAIKSKALKKREVDQSAVESKREKMRGKINK